MKTFFIPARYTKAFRMPEEHLSKLPERLSLVSPIQFVSHLPAIKEQLEAAGKKVNLEQGKHSRNAGQILGCDVPFLSSEKVDAILYIGDGVFHPYEVLFHNQIDLYIYNPKTGDFYKVDRTEAESILKQQKGALAKFYMARSVGVLISTKPGQNRMRFTKDLEAHFPDKTFYFLACDTLDFTQMENFPFIEVFVNTMCQRIAQDDAKRVPRPIINLEDLPQYAGIP